MSGFDFKTETIPYLTDLLPSDLLPSVRNNAYDGVQEFWVIVRESGKKTTESSYEEIHARASKAPNIFCRRPCSG